MSIPSNVPLKEQPFMKGLDQEHLAYMESVCSVKEVPKDEPLFQTGTRAEAFYIIKSGRFDILLYTPERGPQAIERIKPGDLLGYSWILPAKLWQFDCKAAVDSSVFVFDGYAVHSRMKKDPEFNNAILLRFIGVLSDRLKSARKKMQDLYQDASTPLPLEIDI